MKIFLASLSLAVLLSACGTKISDTELMSAAQKAYETKKTDEAMRLYQQLADEYPESPRAAEAMFLLGSIHQNDTKDFTKAVEILSNIDAKYPGTPYAAKGLFVGGFICANTLNDIPRARGLYEKYLASYAGLDANITASVKVELEHLGKSAEETLKALQADTVQQADTGGK